jgi:hypothetical protein
MPFCKYLVFLTIYLLKKTEATHFRGSIITWRPVSRSNYMVEFHYKIAWRWSRADGSHHCNETMIQNEAVRSGEGSWRCSSGCSGIVSPASYICTGYSEEEDWTQGKNSFQYTFEGPGPFVIM